LFQLRWEVWLLQKAYANDINDPDRIGIHESNFTFYFNKYYGRQLSPKNFGHSGNVELADMIKDTVTFEPKNKVLKSSLKVDAESPEIFLKFTEEQRRARQRRIDAGDETARVKVTPQARPIGGKR